jgi:hypothetical protein
VTEPEGVLLDRVRLERAFTSLGERLVRRGVVADVFIVGRAAMALAYDATRATRDVDSLFVPHGIVLEEARNVAQSSGCPCGGSTSRRVSTSQRRTIRASDAYSTIPACA